MSINPSEIDLAIGRRMRQRRRLLGLSQKEVAFGIGVQFQQVQKYECGDNRITAARLIPLCEVLAVPSSFFVEDLLKPQPAATASRAETLALIETIQTLPAEERRLIKDMADRLHAMRCAAAQDNERVA